MSANADLQGTYNYGEVARSALIAIAASYVALDFAGRATTAKGRPRAWWLSGGAIAMGIGIWEVFFKGTVVFRLPVPVVYHWPTVLASLLMAICASAVGLFLASLRRIGRAEAVIGSITMGGAITSMHYVGMAAMRLPAVIHYSPLLVTASILLAIVFSLLALLLVFDLPQGANETVPRKLNGALLLGIAVIGMHYTGMAAARFIPASAPNLVHTMNFAPFSSSGVAIITLIVLLATVITSSTERRHTALALRVSQAELERVTRAMAVGELTTTVAHEINQPLTAVVTDVSASLRWLAQEPPNLDEARAAMVVAIREANRASDVIGRIRALLRNTPAPMRKLEIKDLIVEAVAMVRSELKGRRIAAKIELASDTPPVLGDRIQLEQLFLNLIKNGIDAIAMSTAEETPREIVIKATEDHECVLVQVRDTGKGIDPGQMDRIFEPLFTTKPQGIGMGLAISRSIVEAHGGRLWAENNSPTGAVFQFTLQRADGNHGRMAAR